MPRRASSPTGSKVDARRAQTLRRRLILFLDEADLPGEVPEFVKRGALLYLLTQAAGKLPYATTLWLLDAVARHATTASSDFFCVPFRGARQRARLPTVQTTPPAAPGALYGAFAPQPATRTPSASSACRCRPPHTLLAACAPQAVAPCASQAAAAGCRPPNRPPNARRLRVRRRLPPTFEGERAAREGAENGRGASRRALRDSGGVAPRLALVGCVLCLSVVSESVHGCRSGKRYSWRTVICRSARGRLFLFTFLVVARATTDEHEVSCLAEQSPLSVLPPASRLP